MAAALVPDISGVLVAQIAVFLQSPFGGGRGGKGRDCGKRMSQGLHDVRQEVRFAAIHPR